MSIYCLSVGGDQVECRCLGMIKGFMKALARGQRQRDDVEDHLPIPPFSPPPCPPAADSACSSQIQSIVNC